MKSWLEKYNAEINLIHNDEKSVSFIRTLKNKSYKYMTSVSKCVYIDKLDDIVNKYNNTYHMTIKMKPDNVNLSTSIDTSIENNDKDPQFQIGDIVRISKYKNILATGCTPNWSEEVSVIKKFKKLYHGLMLLAILMEKKLLECFTKIKNAKNYMLNEKGTIIRLIA